MTVWKTSFRNAKGEIEERYHPTKSNAIWVYLSEGRMAAGMGHSEVKIWKNNKDYTATLNKFLNK